MEELVAAEEAVALRRDDRVVSTLQCDSVVTHERGNPSPREWMFVTVVPSERKHVSSNRRLALPRHCLGFAEVCRDEHNEGDVGTR